MRARGAQRGFTLTEVLVALGAVAIISVGVAAVFSAVGETITRGQRVSQFNGSAARFERQIRDDLARITRDGFLVIRHELVAPNNRRLEGYSEADFGELPALFEEDNNPRPRRADELLFFARDAFESQRRSVDPGLGARSGEAMVYYGQGVRYPRDVGNAGGSTDPDADSQHFVPQLAATFDADDGTSGDPRLRLGGDSNEPRGERGPNEYAAGWTLLRRAIVLRPPSETLTSSVSLTGAQATEARFGSTNENVVFDRLLDSRVQIGGVPASPTVFSHANWFLSPRQIEDPTSAFPSFVTPSGPRTLRRYTATVPGALEAQTIQTGSRGHASPSIATGLVDVASTDMATVRRWVLGARREPSADGFIDTFNATLAVPPGGIYPGESFERRTLRSAYNAGWNIFASTPGVQVNELRRMQLWMLDALPGDGLASIGAEPQAIPSGTGAREGLNYRASRARVRYEPVPPAYYDVLRFAEAGNLPDDFADAADQREFRIADQLMLASGALLPRCTEFIVEWSFGRTWPEDGGSEAWMAGLKPGDLIWHGLYRRGDVNSDGDVDDDEFISAPYPVYLGKDRSVDAAQFGVRWGDNARQYWPVTSEQVHLDPDLPELSDGAVIDDIRVLESVFGFVDPTYSSVPTLAGQTPAQNLANLLNNESGDPAFSNEPGAAFPIGPFAPGASSPATVPWAWPRLLRITLSLADPNDPQIEETFQFIVEIPTETAAGG